jgi:hypothetical protein
MRINEIVNAPLPKGWLVAQANAESRGMRLQKETYVKGQYRLEPKNYDEIMTALKAEGIPWHEYYQLITASISKLTDYKEATNRIEQSLKSLPEMINDIKDHIKSGAYDRLQDLQKSLASRWPHGRPQLFMPRPHTDAKFNYPYFDDEGNSSDQRVVNEGQPILPSAPSHSPPGSNKPGWAFWTSSVSKVYEKNGRKYYSSDWIDLVCDGYHNWYNPFAYAYKISPSARILKLDDTHDAQDIYELYHKLGANVVSPNKWANDPVDIMRKDFPWDEIRKHWDGVTHRGRAGDYSNFAYGWDVCSTAWFNTEVLEYLGKVRTRELDHDDDEY